MPTCTKCGKVGGGDAFSVDKHSKSGLSSHCLVCRREYFAKYYAKRKDKMRERGRRDYIIRGDEIRKLRAKGRKRVLNHWVEVLGLDDLSCSNCGYNKCFAALEFHHIDPSKKEHSVSTLIKLVPTDDRITVVKKEVDKCIILCATCHREHHYGEDI